MGDDVTIETIEPGTGWAVFSGCEGEDPQFVAFFRQREAADEYVRLAGADGELFVFDGDAAPAVLVGRLLVANDYDLAAGAEAVIRAAGISDWEARELRAEVTEPSASKADIHPKEAP